MNTNRFNNISHELFLIFLVFIESICLLINMSVQTVSIISLIVITISAISFFRHCSDQSDEYNQKKTILLKIAFCSFLAFGAGHLIILAFNGKNDSLMYIWHNGRYSEEQYKVSIIYTSFSLLFYEFGNFLSYRRNKTVKRFKSIRLKGGINPGLLVRVLFCLAFIVSVFLMSLYKSVGNYSDIYDESYGGYYNYVVLGSLMCIPLYLMIQYRCGKAWKALSNIGMLILIVITLTIGKRSNAIMFVLPLIIINIKAYKKLPIRYYIFGGIGLYLAATILYTVSVTRLLSSGTRLFFESFIDNLISFSSLRYLIIEMGSSIRSLLEIVKLFDSGAETYKCGMTYIYSIFIIVPGVFRGSIDSVAINKHWTGLSSYVTKVSGANYGLGGSVQMETYMNFSIFGVLLFIVIGYVLGDLLYRQNLPNKRLDLFYKVAILSFVIILPRTTMQDNIKRVVYCCIIPFYLFSWLCGSTQSNESEVFP